MTVDYFVSFLGLAFSAYIVFLLSRRKDFLNKKREVYLEFVSAFTGHFPDDEGLVSRVRFLANGRLSTLFDWYKNLEVLKVFTEQRLKGIQDENIKTDSKERLKLIDSTIVLVEREIKIEMRNEIRSPSYEVSSFSIIQGNMNMIRFSKFWKEILGKENDWKRDRQD